MSRNLASAKAAGRWLERIVADYLAEALGDKGIDRQVKMGSKDLGDIRGVVYLGQKVAIECKNTVKVSLPQWLREAEIERQHLGAILGVVVHKRSGSRQPEEQYVTMDLATFATLILLGNEEQKSIPDLG